MDGWDKAPRMVDLTLWTKYTPPDNYEFEIKKCRGKGELVGSTFPSMPFEEIMMVLVPEVSTWE